jgi:site-specific recombinase XerD
VFSAWLLVEGFTKTDVLAKLKRPRLPETVIEVLSDEEINRLVSGLSHDTQLGSRSLAIVLMLYDTGIRANELCTLTLDNIDFARKIVQVSFCNLAGGLSVL